MDPTASWLQRPSGRADHRRGIYALVALGLTLIYGVLHIINFAHGAALMVALVRRLPAEDQLGIDPYLALPIMVPAMFAGRLHAAALVITRASTARTRTSCWSPWACPSCSRTWRLLAVSRATRAPSRPPTPSAPWPLNGPALHRAAQGGGLCRRAGGLRCASCWLITRTDLGRAIRAVAKEKQGARLMGIDVDHVYAMSFGIGLACLGAAACFLLPAYYVNPQVGGGLRAGGLHHRGARRHGQLCRGAGRRPAHRRGRIDRAGLLLGEIAGPDRHFADLHRRAAVAAAGLFGAREAYERQHRLQGPAAGSGDIACFAATLQMAVLRWSSLARRWRARACGSPS